MLRPATIRRPPLRPTSVELSAGFPKKATVEPFPSFLILSIPTEVETASLSNSGSPSVEVCSLSETDLILDLKHNSGKARFLKIDPRTVKTLTINRLIIEGCARLTKQETPIAGIVDLNLVAPHLNIWVRVMGTQ